MNEKKLLIVFILGTILILGGGVMILNSQNTSSKITSSSNAKTEVAETKFDWGQIDYNGPKATKTFKIKNSGSAALQLTNVKTSCTCTSAQIIIDKNSSPRFSMHNTSSWIGEVQPGKEAELVVIFDQTFHGPSGIGPIERIISLETNDLQNPKLEFYLTGNVVKP